LQKKGAALFSARLRGETNGIPVELYHKATAPNSQFVHKHARGEKLEIAASENVE
jgi:hypothetical protein